VSAVSADRAARSEVEVRRCTSADAPDLGRLLHDFNVEYSEPTPDPEVLAERLGDLIERGEATALVAGSGPDGFAVLRFRPSLYSDSLVAYLQELYVVPERRGEGIGSALLERALEAAREAGATHIDLSTSESDTAARALYEKLGFSNREGGPDGPSMLYYERDL
jgi:ribosomal protein S18 acetylase RimI-like enzyme